jgi:ribonuclease G
LAELDRALREQRTRAEIHGFSELGLVELTRHRKRENLRQRLCDPCPHCAGTGYVKSTATLAYQSLRAIRREGRSAGNRRRIEVSLPPAVAAFLAEHEPTALTELADELGLAIAVVEPDDPSGAAAVAPREPAPALGPELTAAPDRD